ncbi:hypothetical protein HQQ79_13385 [Curtobacterium sp. VKM Ac-2852]|nr:hypothetical protein [Curtobacterium sp. VKM Ac-2852]
MPQSRPRHVVRRVATATALSTAIAMVFAAVTPLAASAATSTIAVDFSKTTGTFRGGATGTLYGLGDDGVPSQAVLNGARVTNTSQKPPQGAQHPNGDALDVERSFFAGGGSDLYVYNQDMYPDWAYNGGKRPGDANGDGVWDYLPILRQSVERIATSSAHPEKYVFIPFNEPDGGNWYPDWANQKTQFLADWSAAYDTIQQVYAAHGLGHARIGGAGDSAWHADRTRDLLADAKGKNQLPDVFIWHELGTGSLGSFRSHKREYDGILSDLGISPIPVNITEYGNLRDMGTPGQLVQWASMFESAKVDAQTAYWNYAGNLSDNSSRNNGANGGWWFFKWYGDLAGSQTATLTSPRADVPDTLQGLASIDASAKRATVLVGGGSDDIALNMSGLSSTVFGSTVDVTVRADRLNGAEGASLQPPVISSTRATVSGGRLSVTIPNSDRYAAYQVQVTPPRADRPAVDGAVVSSVEAESTTLANAQVYTQDPAREWDFMASGGKDVGSFDNSGSSATWTVTAPRNGTYRLTALGGANGTPGQQALFVDGDFAGLIRWSADLGWGYRGTAEITLPLTSGQHTLSVRASRDGRTVLPGSNISLDRFELRDATDGDQQVTPAVDARLADGAALTWASGTAGAANLSGKGSATFFTTAAETGYHDVSVRWTSTQASSLDLTVNSSRVPSLAASGAGNWTSTQRIWLPQGVNEVRLSSSVGAKVQDLRILRGATQRAADEANASRVEAEDLTLAGTARAQTLPAGSNGSADQQGTVRDVGFIGNGSGNTMTWQRPPGFGAGDYVLTVAAANADKTSAINYNPQFVSRSLDVTENGGQTTKASFRNTYSWSSFWDRSVPVRLSTATGSLTFGNATAYAPDVDAITLAKLVVGTPTTTAR